MASKGNININIKLSTGEDCTVDFDAKDSLVEAIVAFGEAAVYKLFLTGLRRNLREVIRRLGQPPIPIPPAQIQQYVTEYWNPRQSETLKVRAKKEFIAELMREKREEEQKEAIL